jgi:uncharacterized tellurite resistance protein B-like protein
MAVSMATVDGAISSNEEAILNLLGKAMELSREDVARLRKEASRIDYDSLRQVLPQKEHRMQLFEMACLMAMADGQAKPEEWQLSLRLAKALGLDRNESKECVARARKRLISLVKEHGMVEELRENLKKGGIETQ